MNPDKDPIFLFPSFSLNESANARRISLSGGPGTIVVGLAVFAVVVFVLRLIF